MNLAAIEKRDDRTHLLEQLLDHRPRRWGLVGVVQSKNATIEPICSRQRERFETIVGNPVATGESCRTGLRTRVC